MALLNAYLAFKYESTRGFTEIHPDRMNSNPSENQGVLAVVGYIPGMNPMKRFK